jgi:hypothetical protein
MANKINPDKLRSTIASIKARFETNTIHKMSDLSNMNVTGITYLLGMGFEGFIGKCSSPEKFIVKDIVKLSQVLDVDIELIMKVVLKEAQKNVEPRNIKDLLEK